MDPELVYSPSDFVDIFNQTVDYAYPRVVIEGEISSYRIAKGRWLYFDIKDDNATLRCFGTVYMLPGPLQDGMLVRIVCVPRLHPQFNFSLNIQTIMPVGEGAIAKQAELLFKKLSAEGLFALERKRSLPYPPERLALITSSESAAYADFTKVLRHRWPFCSIDVYDSQVQGINAPQQIVEAFDLVNLQGDPYDVVVVTRGGGSAEDLAAFNDERIVRAIAASRAPTMVAIGHEVDESLAELVSDTRASTPSNAAELLVPNIESVLGEIKSIKSTVNGLVGSIITTQKARISSVMGGIQTKLNNLITHSINQLNHDREVLKLLSPKEVLRRGYSMVRMGGKLIRLGSGLSVGDQVDIIFTDITRKATINGD
jgi:exodeoxyribonuclease VII large subunit